LPAKNKKKQALVENSPLSRERNISVSSTAIYNASLSAPLSNIEEKKRRNRIKQVVFPYSAVKPD
jgi:hypothetical protein